MKHLFITGGASAIAQATARLYAKEHASFYLVDREERRLHIVADDLRVRGATAVTIKALDLNNFDSHAALVNDAISALEKIDIVLIAHGTMPKQSEVIGNWSRIHEELSTNFLSGISLLTALTPYFEEKRKGTIAVISSPAGDRGRQSNYVYGAAKGALTVFTSGLRNQLSKKGVHVLTIKPGFVDTPLTTDFKKGPLWVQPEVIGRGIKRAIEKKKNSVYLPWFWRAVMFIIRNIPERFFKTMNL